MSDSLERRERLAEFSGPRGSMVLVTERRRGLEALTCEVCGKTSEGGIARAVILDEPGAGTWVLYMLPSGWSMAEHSQVAVCPEHQDDPLLRILRFAN